MRAIHTKIVTDEARHPVAVQIDYSDWLEIKRRLHFENEKSTKMKELSRFAGCLKLTEDPVEFQRRIR